jgi:hypothetical protein
MHRALLPNLFQALLYIGPPLSFESLRRSVFESRASHEDPCAEIPTYQDTVFVLAYDWDHLAHGRLWLTFDACNYPYRLLSIQDSVSDRQLDTDSDWRDLGDRVKESGLEPGCDLVIGLLGEPEHVVVHESGDIYFCYGTEGGGDEWETVVRFDYESFFVSWSGVDPSGELDALMATAQ